MASTAQDIINYTVGMLSLPSSTIVAGLPSGGGENDQYTIDSNTQLLKWASEGQDRVARLCMPIYDTATVAAGTAGQATIGPFSTITSASSRVLHTPSIVSIGSRQLAPGNMGFLTSAGNFYPSAPNGDPTAWANNNTAIALSSYTSTPTFTVQGYFLPAPLTTLAQPLDTFLDDFAIRTIAFYVAMMVASKNRDNVKIAAREIPSGNEFIGGVKEIYSRLVQNDPTLAAFFPAAPIDAMVQLIKQMVTRN